MQRRVAQLNNDIIQLRETNSQISALLSETQTQLKSTDQNKEQQGLDLEKKQKIEITNSKKIAQDLFNSKLQLQTSKFNLASLQLNVLSTDKEIKELQLEIKRLIKENDHLNNDFSDIQNTNQLLTLQEQRLKILNDALNSENRRLIEKNNLMKTNKEQQGLEQQGLEQKKQIDDLNDKNKRLIEKLKFNKIDEGQLKTLKRNYYILSSKNFLQQEKKSQLNKKNSCGVVDCDGLGNSRYPNAKKHFTLASCPNAKSANKQTTEDNNGFVTEKNNLNNQIKPKNKVIQKIQNESKTLFANNNSFKEEKTNFERANSTVNILKFIIIKKRL